MNQLSKRLQKIIEMVPCGASVADIGTDHGFVPIALYKSGKIQSAIAMDVVKGPLDRAKEHIKNENLEGKIQVRLSDGLEKLEPGEADTIVIAGMGGALIKRIISAKDVRELGIKSMVLGPQSEIEDLRRYLINDLNCVIEYEDFLEEDGKYYTLMRVSVSDVKATDYRIINNMATDTATHWTTTDYRYGKFLLDNKNAVLQTFLQKKEKQLDALIVKLEQENTDKTLKRVRELREDREYVLDALRRF